MTVNVKRWHRSRKTKVIVVIVLVLCLIYYTLLNDMPIEQNLDITRRITLEVFNGRVVGEHPEPIVEATDLKRNSIIEYIEKRLQEALKLDKGTGCDIPNLDPFDKEVTQFDKKLPKVECKGQDWVRCEGSECRVTKDILSTTKNIECSYQPIIYESDAKYYLGSPQNVYGDTVYNLTISDHVKVKCSGSHGNSVMPSKWTGHLAGIRSTVEIKPAPPGRENSLNVLIFGFDSTSRNGFIRKMPKSYKYLTEELNATILKGYNIVGDGTPAALFPILTGKNELELPDVRKKMNTATLDSMPFIFYKLKEDGYRTAYFEDMPTIGTFQYRFNGFKKQPADHYLRAFYLEEGKTWRGSNSAYCVGDTPRFKLMMKLTEMVMRKGGKFFCFTFIADITHNDFNMIATADDDTVLFFEMLKESGWLDNTLLIVMGDHGPRYADVRETLQGKMEERLPLMGIRLPEQLRKSRPEAQKILEGNAEVLTTPHDIHALVLDVMDMREYWNPYKVAGADLTRGMTLLEPIPRNRSCSEAGIEPHWCVCLSWQNVTDTDPLYQKTANALVDYINSLTQSVRSKCVPRTLTSISWVMRKKANSRMLSFVQAKDADGYVGKFGPVKETSRETYQVKITVAPGRGVYEASMTYYVKEDRFEIVNRDISRTNAYNDEPSCISATHPHLNMYCYCND